MSLKTVFALCWQVEKHTCTLNLLYQSLLFKTTFLGCCQCCSDSHINIYISWYLAETILGRCFTQWKNALDLKSPVTFLFHLKYLDKLWDPPWPGADACSSMQGFPDTFCGGDKAALLLSHFKLRPAPCSQLLPVGNNAANGFFRALTGIFHCATSLHRQEHYTSFGDNDK